MIDAQAAPGLSHDDAVLRVMKIVANLNGEIDADIADVFCEGADVLSALVADTGDAVVVDEHAGSAGWIIRFAGSIGDGAVGDAAHGGEKVAALALHLFRRGNRTSKEIPSHASGGGCANRDRGDEPRGAECEGQRVWKV